MKGRVVLAGLGLWLVVVALGSGLTWMVVQHVARVVSSDAPASDATAGRGSLGVSPSPTVDPSVNPSRTVQPRRTPSAAARPDRRVTPTSRPTPVATSDARPAPPAASAAPVTPPRDDPAPRRTPRPPAGSGSAGSTGDEGGSGSASGSASSTRTWAGAGGRVTVSCSGSRASLVSASPADGWSVEVGRRGGEEVEVSFRRSGSEVQVQGRCDAGTPRFSVERDDG